MQATVRIMTAMLAVEGEGIFWSGLGGGIAKLGEFCPVQWW
jgi:hypothetical protein